MKTINFEEINSNEELAEKLAEKSMFPENMILFIIERHDGYKNYEYVLEELEGIIEDFEESEKDQ